MINVRNSAAKIASSDSSGAARTYSLWYFVQLPSPAIEDIRFLLNSNGAVISMTKLARIVGDHRHNPILSCNRRANLALCTTVLQRI
jgi:hypothetical protein